MTVLVFRGIGHPWTAAPGWDQLLLGADSLDALHQRIRDARAKFWRVWFLSESTLKAHLYKPSDCTREWEDIPWQGTPRGHGHQFLVGDKVYTDFSGRITQHTIVEIAYSKLTQTGVRLRVDPPVPGSGFVADDPGGPPRVYGKTLIDSAWFRKVETPDV